MYLCNQGRLVPLERPLNLRSSIHEVASKLHVSRFSDHDQERDIVAYHGSEFVGLVADAAVPGYGDPPALADDAQPVLISTARVEMVAMALDVQTALREDIRKEVAEVAIHEEYETHAARS